MSQIAAGGMPPIAAASMSLCCSTHQLLGLRCLRMLLSALLLDSMTFARLPEPTHLANAEAR
jgi:hypothetical protein